MQFNLADLWERVVDTVPDHPALVCGDRRLTFAEEDERATRLAHALAARGVGPGLARRVLPLQLDRVPRGDARRVQAAGRPDQRELPLRRGRAAVPARRRRRVGRGVPPRVRTEARRDPRRRSPTSPATSPSTTARRPAPAELGAERLRDRAWRPHPRHATSHARSADDLYILYTGGTTGHAEGRDVAPRGRVLRRAGRRGRRRQADRAPGGDRRAVPRVAHALRARLPVHARHRALDGVQRAVHGRHGRHPRRAPPRRARAVAARRTRAGELHGDRRRRVRAADARRARHRRRPRRSTCRSSACCCRVARSSRPR